MRTELSTQEQFQEIQSIITQYQAEVGSRRRPWPKSIKSRVRGMLQAGVAARGIAEATGIPYATVMSWQAKKTPRSGKFHALTVSARNPPTVTVRDSKETDDHDLTVTVRTPDGYSIEVPVEAVGRLLRQLRMGDLCC